MRMTVCLNGTSENPFHKMGLKQNPFPCIADYRYLSHILNMQKLGADPIPNTDYIRQVLAGWSEEFIEGCVARFKPGEMVKFVAEFPDD